MSNENIEITRIDHNLKNDITSQPTASELSCPVNHFGRDVCSFFLQNVSWRKVVVLTFFFFFSFFCAFVTLKYACFNPVIDSLNKIIDASIKAKEPKSVDQVYLNHLAQIQERSEGFYNRKFSELLTVITIFGVGLPLLMIFVQHQSLKEDRKKIDGVDDKINREIKNGIQQGIKETTAELEALKTQFSSRLESIDHVFRYEIYNNIAGSFIFMAANTTNNMHRISMLHNSLILYLKAQNTDRVIFTIGCMENSMKRTTAITGISFVDDEIEPSIFDECPISDSERERGKAVLVKLKELFENGKKLKKDSSPSESSNNAEHHSTDGDKL